jgi:hypothetical protein
MCLREWQSKKEIKKMTAFLQQRWVKVMKNKRNCDNNVELILLETWYLLDENMAKELNLFFIL